MDANGHDSVATVLAGLRRRQRLLGTLQWGANGLLAGAALGCVAAAASWALWSPGTPRMLATAGVVTGAAALAGAIAGLLMPISDLRLARAMDRAAASEDRFASALQLASHHKRARAQLVIDDAVARVRGVAPAAALPVRVPRSASWIPVPVVVLALLLAFLPQSAVRAVAAAEPDIAAQEWGAIHDEFQKELAQLPKPKTAEEEELQKQLEQLAAMLRENPDKKDALREIARLSERVEQQRRAMGARGRSMKSAAKALSSSAALKEFARKLQEGAYGDAASELRKLSAGLKAGETALDAQEFEAAAAALQQLGDQLEGEQEMQEACENCQNAANSMNREALAEALKRFAEQMEKNAERLRQSDRLGQCSSVLDGLKRSMNRSGRPGEGFCENPGGNKGGLKAGWGSAAKWDGGSIKEGQEERTPDLANLMERQGASTTFQIVSPDERARSGRKYEELYAEFVQKTEADLDLESVPVAYRHYLKRYFNSIRPPESAPAESPEPPQP